MAEIFHDFPINRSAASVFQAVTTPAGLDSWWTKRSGGKPIAGTEYQLWFGPEYDWRAEVRNCITNREFELQLTQADDDWRGTRVRFHLDEKDGITHVHFHHLGWREANQHFRASSFCWAMYLRLLKRHVEHGERVPYEQRLEV